MKSQAILHNISSRKGDNKTMKYLVLVWVVFLGACAAVPTTTVRTLDEKSSVTVLAKELVGARISIDGVAAAIITKEALDKNQFGVLIVKNSARENLDAYRFPIAPGQYSLDIALPDGSRITRRIVVLAGQNAEIDLE